LSYGWEFSSDSFPASVVVGAKKNFAFPGHDSCDVNMALQKETSDAVAEFGRSYLLFVQHILGEDKDNGRLWLGISDEAATLILQLTHAQIDILSHSHRLSFRILFEGPSVLLESLD
jgi:Flagellar transcriptional activator (FlhD)